MSEEIQQIETTETPVTTNDKETPINPMDSLFSSINLDAVKTEAKQENTPVEEKKEEAIPEEKVEAKNVDATTEVKPPTEKAADVTPDEFSKNLSEKSRNRFMEMSERKANEIAEKIVAERLKTVTAKPEEIAAYQKKYEDLEKQHNEVLKTLREVDITRTPEYNERFTKPISQLSGQISTFAKEFGVDGERLTMLLAAPITKANAEALDEITSDLPTIAKQEIAQIGMKLRGIKEQQQAVMADVDGATAAIQEQRNREMQAAAKHAIARQEEAFDAIAPQIKKSVPYLFEGEKASENEALVAAARDALKHPIDSLAPNVRSNLVFKAVMAQSAFNALNETRTQIADLTSKLEQANKTIEGYKKASPTLDGNPGDTGVKKEKVDIWDRINTR